MSSVEAVIKTIELNLKDIPEEDIKKAKKKVGDYLVNSILRSVGNGKSPVEGEKFKKLTEAYAKKEHSGRRLPILELEGDMLEALKHKPLEGNKIEVGIRGSEAPKADGHNQISEEAISWAAEKGRGEYKRRFIPNDTQKFKKKIRTGVEEILAGFRVEPVRDREEREERGEEARSRTFNINTVDADSISTTPERTQLSSSEFFSDDIIEELLQAALKKRRLGNGS